MRFKIQTCCNLVLYCFTAWLRTHCTTSGSHYLWKASTDPAKHPAVRLVCAVVFSFTLIISVVLVVNYIRKVDGLAGCYRGLAPKIFGNILGSIGSERIAIKLGFGQVHVDTTERSALIPDDE